MIGLFVLVLLLLLFLTIPIAVAIGLVSSLIAFDSGANPLVIVQRLFTSLDSFPLLAVPFFILAGNLMEKGGISRRLIDLANAFVGARTGGLGMVAIIASMFFSAISGSGPATTAAIGSIMIPAMVAHGYDKRFASSAQAAAGELGVIIPPSIPLVLFGIAAGVSIGDLFIAGIVPGLMIGFSLMVVMYVFAKRKNYPVGKPSTWKDRYIAFKKSILSILMPVIILGGIYGGFFTPTEAAVVASIYALIVGLFIYKELKFRDLVRVFKESALMSSTILIIISTAGLLGWILTLNKVPVAVSEWFVSLSENPIVFILIINLMLFIIGMFFDGGAAIIILAPILTPIAVNFGIDPVHFGIIMVANLAVGMITPPLGVNLFVVTQIAKIRLESMLKYLLLFVAVTIFDVLIISYVPQLSVGFLSLFK